MLLRVENIQKEWNFKNKPSAAQTLGKTVMFEKTYQIQLIRGTKVLLNVLAFLSLELRSET